MLFGSQFLEIGFFMGLLGSVHCIGMCGPLVMALPILHLSPIQKVTATFLYHLGKIMTYGLLGLVIGLFGKQIPFYNVQQHPHTKQHIGQGFLNLLSKCQSHQLPSKCNQ